MRLVAICVFLVSIPVLALSSEYSTFTNDIIEPYGHYKKSLALTSKAKNKDKAISEVQKFVNAWHVLAEKYTDDVPEPFVALDDFSKKLSRPTTVGKEALELLKAGEVKNAHKSLEEVRYLLWRMRVDVGIVSLNDKVNDFHEAMEIVLDGVKKDDSTQNLKYLGNRYGEWLRIKWAETGAANDSVVDKEGFENVIKKGQAAIATLIDALKNGDAAGAKKAGGSVKKNYKAIFFLPECS